MSTYALEAKGHAATQDGDHRIERATPGCTGSPDSHIKVIGLYGISGSGKSFILNDLKQILKLERFCFYEGSELIAEIVPGGLETFQEQDEQSKTRWRELAINKVREHCSKTRKTAIVAGHFMFWPEHQECGQVVYTKSARATYSHILYLNVPAQIIEQHCHNDMARRRQPASAAHLLKWQKSEQTQLRSLCREHNILFSLVSSDRMSSNEIGPYTRF